MDKMGSSSNVTDSSVPRVDSQGAILPDGMDTSSSAFVLDKNVILPDFILVWKVHKMDERRQTEIKRKLDLRRSSVKLPNEIRRDERRRKIFLNNLKDVGLFVEYAEDSVGLYKFAKIYTNKPPAKGKEEKGSSSNAAAAAAKADEAEQEALRKYAAMLNPKISATKMAVVETKDPPPKPMSNSEQDVLRKYAEILKLRMPMKQLPEQPEDETMMGVYSRDKEYLFNMDEKVIFNYTVRARIIGFVLSRTSYSDNEHNRTAYGVNRLIKHGVFEAAYPVHDPILRENLRKNWASLKKMFNKQPLEDVHEYFGVKVALYFSWLGYYTFMLIPAALVGFVCFVYGWATVKYDVISNDICEEKVPKVKEKMCPPCEKCNYWDISGHCGYSQATYLFDNNATIFLAFFMSLWSAVFMGFWKRYSANIDHKWGLTSFDVEEEQPRPEYTDAVQKTKGKKKKKKGGASEDVMPFWTRTLPFTIFSILTVVLLIVVPMLFVIATILFQVSVVAKIGLSDDARTAATIFVNICTAIFDLLFIIVFNEIYTYIAYKLTELEMPRTETAFDNSLTLKMYVAEFINNYASIVYVAFFKGKYMGTPGHYRISFGLRQEECGPTGCMTELFIQLAIIMVGKQAIGTAQEVLTPYLKRRWRRKKTKVEQAPLHKQKPWEKDFYLEDFGGPQSLFPEYLEMVIQYGLVTLFVAAFPLAPLFALINNVIEVRLDARKFLKEYRRPVAQRVKDIGSWAGILAWVSRLAIITNALIIALTSSFIPKIIYLMEYGSLEGYLDFSLEKFNTSDPTYQKESAPKPDGTNVDICRYYAFIREHDADGREEKLWPHNFRQRELFYWKVWIARLVFIIVFQNVVTLCVEFLRWLIPEMPKKLQKRILREQHWTMEAILMHERMLGRKSRMDSVEEIDKSSSKKKKSKKKRDRAKDATETDASSEPNPSEDGSIDDDLEEDV